MLRATFEEDVYSTDEFRMYCFKVLPCSKRFSHDWVSCPFAHPGEKARRRCVRTHRYTPVACPDMQRNECLRGDACSMTHSVFEFWLHPQRYRTQLCNDGDACRRKICFFAHGLDQLRVPTELPAAGGVTSPPGAANGSPESLAPPARSSNSFSSACSSSSRSSSALLLGSLASPPALGSSATSNLNRASLESFGAAMVAGDGSSFGLTAGGCSPLPAVTTAHMALQQQQQQQQQQAASPMVLQAQLQLAAAESGDDTMQALLAQVLRELSSRNSSALAQAACNTTNSLAAQQQQMLADIAPGFACWGAPTAGMLPAVGEAPCSRLLTPASDLCSSGSLLQGLGLAMPAAMLGWPANLDQQQPDLMTQLALAGMVAGTLPMGASTATAHTWQPWQ